jgi:uncharacterized protein YodC (DUF2158 family)
MKYKGIKMEKVNVGDTVQLKSGGPIMTAESVDEEGMNCVWFVNLVTEPLRQYFLFQTVKKIDL